MPNNYKIVLFHLFTQDYFDNAEITRNQLNNICHKMIECSFDSESIGIIACLIVTSSIIKSLTLI